MTDARQAFIKDMREKKDSARSARHRRTHAGKGGAVRFPHDNMTRKELRKMNGEEKTYRINTPMGWEDFKAMPDDLKKEYVLGIREKFKNPPDGDIAEMFGVAPQTASPLFRRLSIPPLAPWQRKDYDKAGFYAWAGLEAEQPAKTPEESQESQESQESPTGKTGNTYGPGVAYYMGPEAARVGFVKSVTFAGGEDQDDNKAPEPQAYPAKPNSGCLQFEGPAAASLNTVAELLGEKNVKISIIWSTKD